MLHDSTTYMCLHTIRLIGATSIPPPALHRFQPYSPQHLFSPSSSPILPSTYSLHLPPFHPQLSIAPRSPSPTQPYGETVIAIILIMIITNYMITIIMNTHTYVYIYIYIYTCIYYIITVICFVNIIVIYYYYDSFFVTATSFPKLSPLPLFGWGWRCCRRAAL